MLASASTTLGQLGLAAMGSEGMTAVLANNVHATSEASIVVLPQVKAGKLKAIVERMSRELEAGVKSAEFRDKMLPSGIEPEPGSSANVVAFINAERDRLGSLAKKANMQADKWRPRHRARLIWIRLPCPPGIRPA